MREIQVLGFQKIEGSFSEGEAISPMRWHSFCENSPPGRLSGKEKPQGKRSSFLPAKALELLQKQKKKKVSLASETPNRRGRSLAGPPSTAGGEGTFTGPSLLEGLGAEWAAVADVLTEGSALCSLWGAKAAAEEVEML